MGGVGGKRHERVLHFGGEKNPWIGATGGWEKGHGL